MRARTGDALVHLAAHPVAWTLSRVARRMGPVVRVPGFGLVVSDAQVAHEVLQRDEEFVKNAPGTFSPVVTQLLGPSALGNMDGDAHRRLRELVGDLLSPSNACALVGRHDDRIAAIVAALAAGDTIDLVREMRVLSGRLILDMMGVRLPANADTAALELLHLGERITRWVGWRPLSTRALGRARADGERLFAYARSAWDTARDAEGSLVRRLQERGLSFEETQGLICMLFLAGTLTTAAALPRIVALLVDSGQLALLRSGDGSAANAVSEGLRYITPLPATLRVARQEATVAGRHVHAGARVLLLMCNMARDPRLFPDPDRFDITRVHDPRARYLWYGAGPHFCLGFALAQRELQSVLEALAAVPGTLRIVHRRVARGTTVPAYARLDVRLDVHREQKGNP